MKVRILGCSGGIGGIAQRTTSMLVNESVLLDAGTGVEDLALDEVARIDHIFVTHSHLDHVCSIAFIADAAFGLRKHSLVVHALPATINALRAHIFNWDIWPDFTHIPDPEHPMLRFEPLQVGDRFRVDDGYLSVLPAHHVVPAVGYQLDSATGNSFVFTGDTGPNEGLWDVVNRIPALKFLVIETAFCNRERELAVASKHLCPSMLADELARMQAHPQVFITHLKPGEIELTMDEIAHDAAQWTPRMLMPGMVFEF